MKWSQQAVVKTWLALLQPLRWCCADCVIHHERDVREEQKHIAYAWREQAIIREIATHDFYCCLLPGCEALLACRSAVAARGENVQEGCEISSLVEHTGLLPCPWLFIMAFPVTPEIIVEYTGHCFMVASIG